MTDRVSALTVVLESDVREDDVQALTLAIRQLRGVQSVTMHLADPFSPEARRVKFALHEKLMVMAAEVLK